MAAPHQQNGHYVQQQDTYSPDLERRPTDAHLRNTTVKNFAWQDITVTVKDNKTKEPKALLQGVSGIVNAGMYSISSHHLNPPPLTYISTSHNIIMPTTNYNL